MPLIISVEKWFGSAPTVHALVRIGFTATIDSNHLGGAATATNNTYEEVLGSAYNWLHAGEKPCSSVTTAINQFFGKTF